MRLCTLTGLGWIVGSSSDGPFVRKAGAPSSATSPWAPTRSSMTLKCAPCRLPYVVSKLATSTPTLSISSSTAGQSILSSALAPDPRSSTASVSVAWRGPGWTLRARGHASSCWDTTHIGGGWALATPTLKRDDQSLLTLSQDSAVLRATTKSQRLAQAGSIFPGRNFSRSSTGSSSPDIR